MRSVDDSRSLPVSRSRPIPPPIRLLGAWCAVGALALAGCSDSSSSAKTDCFAKPADAAIEQPAQSAVAKGTTVTLITHDSFALSDGVLDQFTAATGINVKLLKSDDAGAMVSQAVVTAGQPIADVMYGIDNTFMCKALTAGVFVPYRAAGLETVDKSLLLDPHLRLTPIDVGDVCVNYWKDAYATGKAPSSFGSLIEPAFQSQFVTEHPDTSSPGFAFLLATIAKYGDSGWEQYWRQLRTNKVEIAKGWTEAYTEQFKAGGGPKSIATSYASSPAAEVYYSNGKLTQPPTAVIDETCFRQVEFAGVLRGTKQPQAAARLVDFLLSETVQSDIPLNMFVFPANAKASVPPEFAQHAKLVARPLTMDPAKIEENRVKWTEKWNQIVLR